MGICGIVQGIRLAGAIGFKEELVRRPAEILGATTLSLLATPHPDVQKTKVDLQAWAKKAGVDLRVQNLRESYDFVDWFRHWNRLLDDGEATINLTAGHAVAISTAGIVAMKRNASCVVWDHLEDQLHHMSPSILLRLDELIPRDRQALQILRNGPKGVGDVAAAMGDRPSTVTRTLQRLESSGFLTTAPDPSDNRRRVAQLRPGVRQFLASV